MNVPGELKYTSTHEWVRRESDGTLAIGITDHAQSALGDIVFIGLPAVGTQLDAGKEAVVVESVKAAADVYAPVAGRIVAVNAALPDAPESVNQDPYGSWLFRLEPRDASALAGLLDAAAYESLVGKEAH